MFSSAKLSLCILLVVFLVSKRQVLLKLLILRSLSFYFLRLVCVAIAQRESVCSSCLFLMSLQALNPKMVEL